VSETTIAQRSFAGGEITPAVYGRVDLVKYQTGAKTMLNFLVYKHGGAANRPGTTFVGEINSSETGARLIPFVFNSDQTYVLEFGNYYIRVVKNGNQVLLTAQNITGVTNANPCVVTYAGADNYADSDEVYITGIAGGLGTYLNNRNFKVRNPNNGANTFELEYMNGTAVDSTAFGAYSSGGTIEEVYTLTAPYGIADIDTINYTQSADVVTLVSNSYFPRELSRTSDTAWSIDKMSFIPAATSIKDCAATVGGAGANTYVYMLTREDPLTNEESIPGKTTAADKTISSVSLASTITITTSAAHGYATADYIYIDYAGVEEIHQRIFKITVTGATTFTLDGEDGSAYSNSAGTGTCNVRSVTLASAAVPTSSAPINVTWANISGGYRTDERVFVYKKNNNGVFGYIGESIGGSFKDVGTEPDTQYQPPVVQNIFGGVDNYPGAVAYAQQRLGFANSNNNPKKTWLSKTGLYTNFTDSVTSQDDDAVFFTLLARQVTEIRHLLDLNGFIVFDSNSEIYIRGDADGIIRPSAINPKTQSSSGTSTVAPLEVGGSALFVQSQGNIVRDLEFEFSADGYKGNDLTIFATHLFEDYTIVSWAYQKVPHSIVWAVRDDGVLLGLTYIKEQQIIAWHRHEFGGLVEHVCCVPEGTETAVYLLIKRTINGSEVRYIERMNTRFVSEETVVDMKYMDSALSYDGRNTGATTMTLSTGAGWTYTDTITITASAATFTASDVGNAIHLEDASGNIVKILIYTYTSTTVVTGLPDVTVPSALRNVATTNWSRAVDTLTGIWHLEGEDVSVFADGQVVGSPNNDQYTTYTVTNGSITLDRPYAVIHVGLPYTSDLETLNIDATQGPSFATKNINVGAVTLFVDKSRGGFVGPKPPSDDDTDPLENLYELKVRDEEGYNDPVALQTGKQQIVTATQWNNNGRIFIRQVDPLPISILSIVPDVSVPV